MKLIIPGTLLLAILLCASLMTTEAKKKGRRRRVKLRERRANLRENRDGSIQFPTDLQYTLQVDGETTRDLDLVLSPYMQLPDVDVKRRQKYAFYTDVNTGESFACKVKRRKGKVRCQMAGLLERNGETCYISPVTGMAECDQGSDDYLNGKLLVLDENWQRVNESSTRSAPNTAERRRKRSILPDPGFKAVETCFVVDEPFMIPFYDRNPGDDAAAVEEAELFITLLANEMTVFYSSVKEVSMGALDLVIYPSCFRHPGRNNNFAWSQNNIIRSGTALDIDDALPDFNTYRIQQLQGVQYDHVMGLTGLDLFVSDIGTSLLGVAFVGTVCSTGAPAVSLQENIGFNLGWIASHELGHALGSDHDQTPPVCPSNTNVMSASLFFPDSSTQNTYSRFSTCSVDQFISHLNNRPDCTADSGFTDVQFQAAFCSGLLGQVDISLDRQCQVRTRSSTASACSTAVSPNGCYLVNSVSCRSTPQGSCSTSLLFVWNGTPCGTGSFCYKGNCVPEFDICPTTQAPTTQAPTTLAPTTQAPTTLAPTTLAPTTQAPTTQAPTTQAPTTQAPTTQAPTTLAPTTQAPTTLAPTTLAPTTLAPTTLAPTTLAPTTLAPTTQSPTTQAPTTQAPTTQAPTTQAPTTQAPVTTPDVGDPRTSEVPTTAASTTTAAPTTTTTTAAMTTTTTSSSTTTSRPSCSCCRARGRRRRRCCRRGYRTGRTCSCCPPLVTQAPANPRTNSPATTTTTTSSTTVAPTCSCCRFGGFVRRYCCRIANFYGRNCLCC